MTRTRLKFLLSGTAALLLAACGTAAPATAALTPSPLTGTVAVSAAASLTGPFKAIASAFEAQHPGVRVQLNLSGTPILVAQIEQGAPTDVFASADTANMDALTAAGFTSGTPRVFAHNRLEIVVAPGNPKGITGLAGLARPDVLYISEAATVPAGRYSIQALARAGVSATPKSLETDVKSVIAKVELGEADAGIVYSTDVAAAGTRVSGVTIPEQFNVVATYPVVAVRGGHADLAAAFIAYLLSPAGQSTLAAYGFIHA